MSSTRARDVPKGTGGGGSNKTVGKPANKGDHKSDKADLNPKIQATAEQMQIARIIESHRSEDPELQKKIKQVIEFTRASEDEASMALHSRENNVEEAIALLTEGGAESLESEWAQAGKKRKTKNPGQKNDALKEGGPKKDGIQLDNASRDRSEKRNDRDSRPDRSERDQRNNSEQQFEGSFDQRRGGERGRGRGSSRGVRGSIGRGGGRIENNKENDESGNNSRGGFVGRFNNGPGRGGRGGREGGGVGFRGGRGGGFRGGDRDRDSSRTFASRARGPRDGDFGHHTIDVWENSQADPKAEKKTLKVEQWDEFPSAEDWDNEEYTGSLAESKVFTASTLPQTSAGVNSAPTDTVTGGSVNLQTETSSNGFGGSNHIGGGANLTTAGNGVVAGQSIDLTLLLQNPAPGGAVAANSNPGVKLLASIQSSSYSSAAAQQAPGGNNQQPLPPRSGGAANKVQPRRGPPTKIPSSGVEMPDESVAKLDVQFGGLDFGTTGSAFNTVVQHGTSKVAGGAGDMMYSNLTQPKMDTYSAAAEKETVQNKPVPPPTSASAFQNQQRNPQPAPGSMIIDSLNSKTVPIPPNIDNTHSGSLSSVQSQNTKVNNVPQSPQAQQQQPSYGSSANNTGSAFVTYNTKPAPGFPAPGFPPVSQIQQPGTYGVPQGPGYGSSSNPMIMHQQATAGYHGVGLSTYGTQPLVSASVQPSQLQSQQIPSQGYPQLNNSTYGVPGMSSNPYQNTNTIPNSSTYVNSSTYTGYGAQKSSLTTPGLSGKETANDVSNATTSASSGQLGSAGGLQSNSGGTSSTTGSKVPTNATSVTNSSTGGSKLQSGVNSALPPGMMLQPQYILNQAGVPLYGFQGPPMYGYDESQQVQFLPRLPHPLAAGSYYDANAAPYTPGGGVQSTGRSDGASLQGYGADARFSRSDSSTASPVPSNLAGQSTQQMYNLPQAGYYYVGNNMMHPGPFPYGPPTMYPTTAMATPNNPSSGAQHSVANHQYQNKGYGGSSYVPPYETTGQPGNMIDYVNKNTYTTGSGLGGQNSTGKGSASTTGGSSQSTDMSSSLYGKPHLNKLNNPYEKQQYGGNTGSPYGSLGQQSNQLGGAGMGAAYNVYLPPPQPDGSSGQRQGGGQPKGGKQQYAGQQQQYWSGN